MIARIYFQNSIFVFSFFVGILHHKEELCLTLVRNNVSFAWLNLREIPWNLHDSKQTKKFHVVHHPHLLPSCILPQGKQRLKNNLNGGSHLVFQIGKIPRYIVMTSKINLNNQIMFTFNALIFARKIEIIQKAFQSPFL